MARPKRAEINDVNRRGDPLVAAARLFQEKGFHATTMRDIAKATHMQPGSPFYHFASKHELLYAGIASSLLECMEALEAIDPVSMSPLDYVRALARAHLARLLDNQTGVVPMVVDEWRHMDGPRRDQVVALRGRFEALWKNAFNRLRDAGIIGRCTPLTVTFFLSALNGTVNWYKPSGSLSVADLADELVAFATASGTSRLQKALCRCLAAMREFASGISSKDADRKPRAAFRAAGEFAPMPLPGRRASNAAYPLAVRLLTLTRSRRWRDGAGRPFSVSPAIACRVGVHTAQVGRNAQS